MADHQYSIPDGAGGRIFIDQFGDGEYLIEVGTQTIRFEWSDRFGPIPVTKSGKVRDFGHRHAFWRAASLWRLQGSRLEGNKAIWHEPRKPVYEKKHLGGRRWLITKVIDPGEEGHDW